MRRYVLDQVVVSGAGSPVAIPASRVDEILTAKEGSPFEIVAVQTLLARWIGIPARIGYGFDGGALAGDPHREYRPRDGAVFPQVYFEGNGWLPVIGIPAKTKVTDTSDPNLQQFKPGVLPSDDISVTLFRPVERPGRTLLYERLRIAALVAVAVLLFLLVVYLAAVPIRKSWLRSRRRADAFDAGTRARVAQAYAEFRDLLTDFGYHHETDTPLMLLRRFPADEEHKQLAWLVTRSLWGDLAGTTRPRSPRTPKSSRQRCAAGCAKHIRSRCGSSRPSLGCRCARRTPWRRSIARSQRTRRGSSTMSRCRALAAIGLLVLSACGTAASRVAVEHDQTDIVFGFRTPPPVKRAAAATPPATGEDEIVRPFTPKPFPSFEPSEPQVACPTADPDAPISGSAGNSISGRPEPGTYRWNASGYYIVQGTKIPMTSPTKRWVRNVKAFADDTGLSDGRGSDNFTYELIERRISATASGYWLFRYQVKTSSAGSDPEAGLVLRGIDLLDDRGKPSGTYFSPLANGLLLAPFPVKAGAKWDSTSVDLGRGQTFQLSGQYLTRQAVDVCGTLVQGWHLRAEMNATGGTSTIDAVVSPDRGGQIISFTVDGNYLGSQFAKANVHTGQLDPDPLPPEFVP